MHLYINASDPDAIAHADPVQYGILNTQTSLNCSSSFDKFENIVIITWFSGRTETRTLLGRWPEFNTTEHNHGGLYTCLVHVSRIDIRIEKTVEFIVLGK